MEYMENLVQAVRNHSGMEDDRIREAGRYGADAGWPGFTYTQDCVEFYKENERDIWELLADFADDMGMEPMELIASFRGADMAKTPDGLATLLAWFALEEAGRWLKDRCTVASEPNDAD